ncbi:cell wall-binding repeat-containing protein [Ammoniphilus sp. 3BR4]|uniref:cell wall-binding repeat-containing protein n=1 Tax=Ammoniphilus sp. 3BR4 TaxID=3158265 RepID=UPI003467B74D
MKSFFKLLSIGALSAALVACTNSETTPAEPQPNQAAAPAPASDVNVVTKNTSRVLGSNAEEISISTSKMIWPATPAGTTPNVVLVAPDNNWQVQLVTVDLIHHPSDGPLLVSNPSSISDAVMTELKRLNPKGAQDGTQVIAVGMDEAAIKQLGDANFKVKEIKGDNPAQIAGAIDDYYASVCGELPQSVIVSTSEQLEYAAPAGNWIAHMPEPLLYVTKDDIPEETDQALNKRNGQADIYLLGPESAVSKQVEEDLKKYGQVTRIAGDDPYTNAIAFAKYKDPNTGFGWGITQPGHGLMLVNKDQVNQAIPAVAFSHRGKHAPMLLSDMDTAPDTLLAYLKELKPLFTKDPTEGPYNHLFIVGGSESISNDQQGNLDHLIEIESASGGGHGAHGGEPMPAPAPADEPAPMDHGKMGHSNH